jgi:hypothetical protein
MHNTRIAGRESRRDWSGPVKDPRDYIRIPRAREFVFSVPSSRFATQSSPNAKAPRPGKASGGRPPKFAWDDFWIEIVRIAELDGVPDRQELHRRMVEFVLNWPEQPEESEIRKRLSKLYKQEWMVRES